MSDRSANEPHVESLLTASQLADRVRELGAQISADYAGTEPLLVGVLKGSWVFMADLVRALTLPAQCDFVMVSTYGMNQTSSGTVTLRLDLTSPPAGRHVLLVDDIIDTGLTTHWLLGHLGQLEPSSLRVCTLLDKPSRREVRVDVDYVGFTIPDRFVVGYGIDFAERYRQLPFVGYIDEPVQD